MSLNNCPTGFDGNVDKLPSMVQNDTKLLQEVHNFLKPSPYLDYPKGSKLGVFAPLFFRQWLNEWVLRLMISTLELLCVTKSVFERHTGHSRQNIKLHNADRTELLQKVRCLRLWTGHKSSRLTWGYDRLTGPPTLHRQVTIFYYTAT